MRRGASNSGWRIVVPGLLLAVLAAGACSSPERPAPAPEPDAGEPVTAPALRGAHESVDNPQETYTDERGLRVEGLGIDFPARTYPASATFRRDRRRASGCRSSRWPISTASRSIFTPTGAVGGRRRVLPLGRMVTVLQDAAGRAAAPTGRVRGGRFQDLRCQLRCGRGIAGVL